MCSLVIFFEDVEKCPPKRPSSVDCAVMKSVERTRVSGFASTVMPLSFSFDSGARSTITRTRPATRLKLADSVG